MAVNFIGLPNHTAIRNYSIIEDGVSRDAGNTSVGVPQFSADLPPNYDNLFLMNTDVLVDDSYFGRTATRVAGVTSTPESDSITLETIMSKLVVDADIAPLRPSSLEGVVRYFFRCAKVEDLNWWATPLARAKVSHVSVPASNGSVWTAFKRFLSANNLDVNFVYDTVVVSDFGENILDLVNAKNFSYSHHRGEPTELITVNVYHKQYSQLSQVLPVVPTKFDNEYAVDNTRETIISVGKGKVTETEIRVRAETEEVYQPACVESINLNAIPQTGCYTVVGKDNRPIKPRQWLDNGGNLTVSVKEDRKTIVVSVTGANIPHLEPFRVCESAGGTDYGSLYVFAKGIFFDIQPYHFYTGAKGGSGEETIDNPNIDSLSKGIHAAAFYAERACNTDRQLTVDVSDPLREDFNLFAMGWSSRNPQLRHADIRTGKPLPQRADLTWHGITAGDIVPDLQAMIDGMSPDIADKRRQLFGRLSGARVFAGDSFWRVDQATLSPGGVSLSCTPYTTIDDLSVFYPSPGSFTKAIGKDLLTLSLKGLFRKE